MDIAAVAAAVPPEVIEAYISETFPAQLQGLIRAQPPTAWAQPEKLLQFAAVYYQRSTAACGVMPLGKETSAVPPVASDCTTAARAGQEAQPSPSPVPPAGNPDSMRMSSPQETTRTLALKRVLDFPRQGGASLLKDIEEVYTIDRIPECWPVPRVKTAYVLDLRGSQTVYSKNNGQLMSMDAIIKQHDQDSWGGGSGGSRDPTKQTSVALLGGVKCMQSSRTCNGLFVCSRFDSEHLHDYERYQPDWEKTSAIFAARQRLNEDEGSTPMAICATYYNLLVRTECPTQSCKAAVALHALDKISFEGKSLVVGCAGARANDLAHRRYPIPRSVDEGLLQDIFKGQGAVTGTFEDDFTRPCAFMVHPRTGKRGRCNFLHVHESRVVQPSLTHVKCSAKMTVYFPVDTGDLRAVVVIAANQPHSHPSFPSYKLSYAAKEKVESAIRAMGPLATSVQALRAAPITTEITGAPTLGQLHPSLEQDRTVRLLIQKERKTLVPLGTGLTAVFDCMRQQRDTLPPEEVYIHDVSDNGIPVIICMLPRLAAEVHSARSLVVDMTYKTVSGDFKLWHVVMYSAKYNRRLVVARIFSTHESEEAFLKMWDGFFDCVAKVTGRPLAITALHKKGRLHVIACDGDAAQAGALAKSVHKRHDPSVSGLVVRTPADLLPYFFRTCTVHSDANLDKLAPACDAQTLEYLRGFYFMKTDEEVAIFHRFCKSSPFPAVVNWYQNKVVHSWYLPSLVQYLSKIPADVWQTTRGETNLAESSHAATNAAIGTRLQLLVAIDRLHQHDLGLASGLAREDSSSGIVKDKHNTFEATMRSNMKRKVRNTERALAEQQLKRTIGDLEEQIDFHSAQKRKLQEEKENLTSTGDSKKKKTRGRK